jgi:hypothetical protein
MRTKNFFYSERQNKMIEKAALSGKKLSKKAETLARQFNRSKDSIYTKMLAIRAAKNIVKKESKPLPVATEKMIKIAEGTVINFNNVKKAEMHSDHVRIYF